MRTPPSHATMADVAREAGVSTATVSRVLAGTRPVAPEYQRLVEEAAERLGYRVNLVGRALRQRRTSTVGIVVPDLANPFFSALVSHLSRTFEGSGIDLLVFTSDNDLAVERRGVLSFVGRQVDALVLIPCHERGSAEAVSLANGTATVIQLDRRVAGRQGHFVGCDNAHGMRLVARHVTECVDTAAQPVVYVGAEESSSSGRERLKGFRRAFRDGASLPAYSGPFSFEWGQRAADLVLADGFRRATLVVAADVIALGLLARLLRLGHAAPDDFRIIGFDGVGVAPFAHPTLTTVRQPVEAMGQRILQIITSAPEGEVVRARVEPTLILGETSPGRRDATEGS